MIGNERLVDDYNRGFISRFAYLARYAYQFKKLIYFLYTLKSYSWLRGVVLKKIFISTLTDLCLMRLSKVLLDAK
ncbi:hypothetical protein BpHYR1_000693 [Brachionus plicatilis]|uniref:Uncharacterized protein n=1 Tax=Brachionus plicatilis TaxID=10195 RepID=A0A3M7T6E6_BRAPC|nr:hypothetical protein BpHYR1_000693 [Brachionus plicatilis]